MLVRPLPAVGLVATVALAWLVAAAVIPTRAIEAEAMRHDGGIPFGAYQTQPILWIMTREGDLSERIVTWPGVTRITVVAAGLTTTGVAPRMALLVGDQVVGEWTLEAGPGRWIQRRYVASTPTGFGRPLLRLRFTQTRDHRGSGALQHAYVDRVLLERVDR
jgi:hypothetical protein